MGTKPKTILVVVETFSIWRGFSCLHGDVKVGSFLCRNARKTSSGIYDGLPYKARLCQSWHML